ncbi:hypothetical protein [Herbidospora mongoliensis]|uniref:hypothetical protein n=1 Tax=Herbidospora mongoliensis TaxID=688067 RepID=UPI00082BC7A2|nr:hypothetical protein [Herbidospora mongoliensis]
MIRKLAAGLATAAAVAALLAPAPALAEVCSYGFCGSVKNNLPSNFHVKVATFDEGSEICDTYNAGRIKCKTYWLPSGRSSSQIGVKDADGFMVEQQFRDGYVNGVLLSGGTWVKIPSSAGIFCSILRGSPIPSCHA